MISKTDPKYINGYPKQIKSLLLEILVRSSITTGNVKVYLNDDPNSNQLNNKIITSIICNTRLNGNIAVAAKKSNAIIEPAQLRDYGYTITLVDPNNQFLVYSYPLTALLSTRQGVAPLNTKRPRTYNRFNLEIDPNKSYVTTFDPSLLTARTYIISLTFFYYDK